MSQTLGFDELSRMLREGATVLATDIDPVRGQALVDSLAPVLERVLGTEVYVELRSRLR